MRELSDQEKLQAMYCIPPNAYGNDEWSRVVMAASAAGIPADEIHEWCKSGDGYIKSRTESLIKKGRNPGSITAGTLVYYAREHGFSTGGTDPVDASFTFHKDAPGESKAKMDNGWQLPFEALPPADYGHHYIRRKNGDPDGLRVLYMDNVHWLVVPFVEGGKMVSFQRISGDGRKLTAPGSMGNSYFSTGTHTKGGVIHVCEGIGQAWACKKAMGGMAVVTGGIGRFEAVSQQVAKEHPGCKIVLVPDAGESSVEIARKAARKAKCKLFVPPPEWEKNKDVNDYLLEHNGYAEALEKLLRSNTITPVRYKMIRGSDIFDMPSAEYIIHNLIPDREITFIFGPSGHFKTFFALDVCLHVATGKEFLSRSTQKRPVIYIASEGTGAIKARAKAWCDHYQMDIPDTFCLVSEDDGFALNSEADIADMIESIDLQGLHGALIVVDTLNQASGGTPENDSAEMGRLIKAAKTMARKCKGALIIVHHSGHDNHGRMRGSSAIPAAGHLNIKVAKNNEDDDFSFVQVVRNKEGECDFFYRANLNIKGTGMFYTSGNEITSCWLDYQLAEMGAEEPKAKNGHLAKSPTFKAFWNDLQNGKRGKVPEHPDCPAKELSVEIPRIAEVTGGRPDNIKRFFTLMVNRGTFAEFNGWVCYPANEK